MFLSEPKRCFISPVRVVSINEKHAGMSGDGDQNAFDTVETPHNNTLDNKHIPLDEFPKLFSTWTVSSLYPHSHTINNTWDIAYKTRGTVAAFFNMVDNFGEFFFFFLAGISPDKTP